MQQVQMSSNVEHIEMGLKWILVPFCCTNNDASQKIMQLSFKAKDYFVVSLQFV